MATKFSISEQVLRRLKNGRPDIATKTDIREIALSVGQTINTLASDTYYNTTLPTGETIPDGSLLFAFESVAVEAWKNTARSMLPAFPIHLPRNMGIFSIQDPNNTFCVFIPVLPGQLALLQSQDMISDLFDYVAYEPMGNMVQYNRDITQEGITAVTMMLVVSNVGSLGDTDLLPIPASMEEAVVDTLFKRFAGQLPNDEKTDVLTDKTVAK
jgi:hypothetical protein